MGLRLAHADDIGMVKIRSLHCVGSRCIRALRLKVIGAQVVVLHLEPKIKYVIVGMLHLHPNFKIPYPSEILIRNSDNNYRRLN